MDGFTYIDACVVIVILISALLAYFRGFVREFLAIAGWIGSAVIAFMLAPMIEPLIKHIPVIGGIISDSCELGILFSFAVVFAAGLIVFSLFTPFFSSIVQHSALGAVDQGFGFLFGVARGVFLIAIMFFVADTINAQQSFPVIEESRSISIFDQFTNRIKENNPETSLGWVTNQYEYLVRNCD